jgi:hypothetical protein
VVIIALRFPQGQRLQLTLDQDSLVSWIYVKVRAITLPETGAVIS